MPGEITKTLNVFAPRGEVKKFRKQKHKQALSISVRPWLFLFAEFHPSGKKQIELTIKTSSAQ